MRRHQAALVIAGLGLLSDAVMRTHVLVEGALGLVGLVSVASVLDGLTIAEVVVATARFLGSRKWRALSAIVSDGDVALWAGGDVALRGYELEHRGRLDLSGRDLVIVQSLAALADAASAAAAGRHFSVHVHERPPRTTTLLALPVGLEPPTQWSLNNDLALEVMGLGPQDVSLRLRERGSYVRTAHELVRVYRIRDFSSVPDSRALLEQFLRGSTPRDLTLHVDVVAGSRAHRLAARAVHRVDSDDATSRSVGFRRNARTSRSLQRLRQREGLVASGRSLLRLAVFVVVRATTLEDLQHRSGAVWREAHDAGLRLERGWGRQASWYFVQLPGGPGW